MRRASRGVASVCAGILHGLFSAYPVNAADDLPDQNPYFGFDIGMHTGPIRRLGVDATCSLIATAGGDKTARLWDVRSGSGMPRLLRTIRLPIGKGEDGKIFAIALSPDGRWIAVGGWDAQYRSKGYHQVYVLDSVTGQIAARVGELPTSIYHLVFSTNGKFLASTLRDGGGMRVWETSRWREVGRDDGYEGASSNGAAFGPDGALYTVDYRGMLRRYDSTFTLRAIRRTPAGNKAHSVSVRPDGSLVAVGFDDNAVVDVYDATSLDIAFTADARDIQDISLRAVSWSSDGSRLYAGARTHRMEGINPLIAWDLGGRGARSETILTTDSVSQILPCGQKLALSAADPTFGIVNEDGTAAVRADSSRPDLIDHVGEKFTVAPNGHKVRFSLGYRGRQPVVFDLDALTLTDAPGPVEGLLAPNITGLAVSDWRNTSAPTLERRPLKLDRNETSRSLAIAPDDARFVIGAEWTVRGYNAAGDVLWERPAPNTTWGVNIASEGSLFVAAYADGTIRWHRTSDGEELLALFVHTKDRRFVLWTPKGYYFASPGADDLIGWQVNRSWDAVPDFFPVSRFRSEFYRPDIIRRVLSDLDEDEAIRKANRTINRRTETRGIREQLPPVVSITSPPAYSTIAAHEVGIEYALRSATGGRVGRVFAQIDGRPVDGAEHLNIELLPDQEVSGKLTLKLPPGDASVSIIAETDRGASTAASIKLLRVAQSVEDTKSNLFSLLIGVGKYRDSSVEDLGSVPSKDARNVADKLAREEGRAFRKVNTRVLADEDATQVNVLDGLEWLLNNVKDANDVALFYFSGHGVSVPGAGSYLLPVEYDPDRSIRTVIDKDQIVNALRRINGKVIVFVDACHAAGNMEFSRITGGRRLDTVGLLNDFSAAENGMITFASSMGDELSYADASNSFFTKALIEALSGAVRPDDRLVRTDDIIGYLRRRVSYLASQKQRRQTPAMAGSPRAKPVPLSMLP